MSAEAQLSGLFPPNPDQVATIRSHDWLYQTLISNQTNYFQKLVPNDLESNTLL